MTEENPHFSRYPPFQNLRQFAMTSGKRAHSPDESPGDRPTKRLSPAAGDVSIGYRHFSTSSVNSSRYPSEDWVQQAGGLTINSPIFPLMIHRFPVQAPDVEMSMESDENRVQPMQASSYPFTTPAPQHQHSVIESQLPNTLRRHYERRHSEIIQPDVAPATPVISAIPPDSDQSEEQPPTRPSTPPNSSPTAMVLCSPVTSFSHIPSPKKRVFFGPRTGCEKCRLGVTGHFIHSE